MLGQIFACHLRPEIRSNWLQSRPETCHMSEILPETYDVREKFCRIPEFQLDAAAIYMSLAP